MGSTTSLPYRGWLRVYGGMRRWGRRGTWVPQVESNNRFALEGKLPVAPRSELRSKNHEWRIGGQRGGGRGDSRKLLPNPPKVNHWVTGFFRHPVLWCGGIIRTMRANPVVVAGWDDAWGGDLAQPRWWA